MNVPNYIYLNLHSKQLGGKVVFIPPPANSLLSPKCYNFPHSLIQFKELPGIPSMTETIFLQVFSLTILEACLAIL